MKRKTIILLIVPLVYMFAGCSKLQEQPASTCEENTFLWTAEGIQTAGGTKTVLEGTTLSWAQGDAIGLFIDGVQENRRLSNTTENNFSGGLIRTGETRVSVDYYAYYPYVYSATPSTTVSATLPTDQVAPFDGSANFMVADSETTSYDETNMPSVAFSFNNQLMSIVKVTINNTDEAFGGQKLNGIELVATSGETLTGAFSFDITTPAADPVFSTTPADVSNRVKVTFAEGDRPVLGTGESHVVYALVNPTTVASLKLIIKTTDYVFVTTTSVGATFTKGFVIGLPPVDIKNATKNNRVRTCILWGDSLFGGFPAPLQKLLGDDWLVISGGVGGDTPLGIAGRQGGIPMCLNTTFTVPASKNEEVNISRLYSTRNTANESALTGVGFNAWYTNKNSRLNPVTLKFNDGVKDVEIEGTIIIDGDYRFRRSTDGEAVSVPAGATVESYGSKAYKDAEVFVMLMGANSGWASYEALAGISQSLVDHSTTKQFVLLGFHFPHIVFPSGYEKTYWTTEYRDVMRAAFGDHYVDMWTIGTTRESAMRLLKETGAYPSNADSFTDADEQALQDGYLPQSFASTSNYSDVHLNGYGSKAMAILIKEKMEELGYLDY